MTFEEFLGTVFGYVLAVIGPPVFFLWVASFATGLVIAYDKGKVSAEYMISLIIFGPFPVFIMLFLRPNEYVLKERSVKKKISKWCPFCYDAIPIRAIKCLSCSSKLSPLRTSFLRYELQHKDESLTARKGIKAQLGTALSTEDANRAIYRYAKGESIRQIAQDTNIPYNTLANWVEKYMTDDEWMHKVNIARRATSRLDPEIDDNERKRKRAKSLGFRWQ